MKKEDNTPKANKHCVPVYGWYGIALLFTAISIMYANYVVYFGTTGLIPKLMLIPSTLFVALFLVIKAAK